MVLADTCMATDRITTPSAAAVHSHPSGRALLGGADAAERIVLAVVLQN